jgi:hypothetical protein
MDDKFIINCKMKNITSIILIAIFSLLVACKDGENGSIGPVGNKGPKGAIGDKGDTGLTDSKGLVVSPWIDIKPDMWGNFFTIGTLLNAENVTKGNIYFYMKPEGSTLVFPMPYAEPSGITFSVKFTYDSFFERQTIFINYETPPSARNIKVTSTHKIRMVVLPSGSRISADLDMRNYDSVKKHFGLPD